MGPAVAVAGSVECQYRSVASRQVGHSRQSRGSSSGSQSQSISQRSQRKAAVQSVSTSVSQSQSVSTSVSQSQSVGTGATIGGSGGAAAASVGTSNSSVGASTGASGRLGGASGGLSAGAASRSTGSSTAATTARRAPADGVGQSITLPLVLLPSGRSDRASAATAFNEIPGTPAAVVRACSDAVGSAAAPFGVVSVRARSAGSLRRLSQGEISAPV